MNEVPLRYAFHPGRAPESPLFVLVHGRAGNPQVMSPFRRCVPAGSHVVLVQAPREDDLGGYSWWRVGSDDDPGEGASQLSRSLRLLPGVEGIHPTRIVAFGFSQGAATISLILQTEPHLLAGAALLAGMVLVRSTAAPPSDPPPVFFAHGTRDGTVPIEEARAGARYFASRGHAVEFHEDDVTHKVGSGGMKALTLWASRFGG